MSYSLDERLGLHISHGSSYLCDDDVVVSAFSEKEHSPLDLISNVGNYLHCLAEVCAFALLGDDRVVYLSCGNVVGFGSAYAQKPFVMSQIEVCFRSVIGDIAFPVLVRVQCPRVNVDIWVELLDCDP